ncbi:N-(5'-phosphoribosyl)anthranilate isomerase [Alicyclobacillus contaminans]|uniref:phosphoribosylanthranilate isomerase n=1 Tax=Alicyclobacillus contaminans TaxID=392016 RepID=UPI000405E4DD|nr:phosphoribosylanthranilate isomerase [Alicyclobacillus contaminans]GMA48690.1 N-(5'-phosphoribosyl)anthranilate isomerase [Alicyclobacillus contaminans]
MTVRLKICGLQAGDDVGFAASPRVAHVGFVFVPQSRRYIRPVQARELVEALPRGVAPVGVFVNETLATIAAMLNEARVSVAQLHGDESPELCAELRASGYTVWKSLSVPRTDPNLDHLVAALDRYSPVVDAILLDASPPKTAGVVSGGHGQAWDWSILTQLLQRAGGKLPVPLWVAGGIRPDNVARLLETCLPDGIDVSSGVERDGRKDPARIQKLIEAVNQSDQ